MCLTHCPECEKACKRIAADKVLLIRVAAQRNDLLQGAHGISFKGVICKNRRGFPRRKVVIPVVGLYGDEAERSISTTADKTDLIADRFKLVIADGLDKHSF